MQYLQSMENIHYYDKGNNFKIETNANTFIISLDGVTHTIILNISFIYIILSKIRLCRGLLRLDKSNAIPVFKNHKLKSIVIVNF